jgi:hypothetical protein
MLQLLNSCKIFVYTTSYEHHIKKINKTTNEKNNEPLTTRSLNISSDPLKLKLLIHYSMLTIILIDIILIS